METEWNLKILLKTIDKKKFNILLIIAVIIALFITYYLYFERPIYNSSFSVFVDKPDQSMENIVLSDSMLKLVSDNIEDQKVTPDYIKKTTTVTINKEQKTLSVSVNSDSPDLAYIIAKQFQTDIKDKLIEIYSITKYEMIKEPIKPIEPINNNSEKYILRAIIVMGLAIVIYMALVMYKQAIFTEEQLKNSKINYIGKVNKNLRKNKVNENDLRSLVKSIQLNSSLKNSKLINFIKVKQVITIKDMLFGLANNLTKYNKNILIIERRSTNRKSKDSEDKNRLEYIFSDKSSKIANIARKSKDNLYILTVGNNELYQLDCEDKINALVKKLKDEFDYIFIQTAEEEENSEIWNNAADTNIIVVEYGKTTMPQLEAIKQVIEDMDGKVAGAIVDVTKK